MGNSFRQQPGPTLYEPNKTPVTEDLLEVGILVAFGMIAFSFILIIPGIRGWERLWAVIRVFTALWIGAVILFSNFGYGWYVDTACVRTQYKAYVYPPGSPQEIEAEVGLHIGLRGINITLKEVSVAHCLGEGEDHYVSPFPDEEIDYNERFEWADPWAQGRIGFGRYAGKLNQEFRAAQFRGMPYPILWIAEYFTLDGEQIRWARKFRQAGWYTHIFLWLSFATYLLSMLLFIFVIRPAAWFTVITGLVMVLACFSFGIIIQNDPKLKIPFANEEQGTVLVDPQFGWSWYLTLVTGIVTVFLGIFILLMEFFFPRKISIVFHHHSLIDDDFFEITEPEGPGVEEQSTTYSVTSQSETRRSQRATSRQRLSRYRQIQRRSRNANTSQRFQRLKGSAGTEIRLEEVPSK